MAFVSVGVDATQRIPLSILAENPHKGLAREIFHETERGRGKEGPRDQSAGERAEEKESVKRSGQNRPVERTDQSIEVGGS